MVYFDWEHNALTGPIPSEVGQMTDLAYLNLAHNRLSGEIPSQIEMLADHSLTANGEVDLDFNTNLTGTLPGVFCTDVLCSSLKVGEKVGCCTEGSRGG